MWLFRKISPFELILDAKYVTLVGAGGKTSFIEYLAGVANARGKSVAITTTTKILAKEPYVLLGKNGVENFSGSRFVRVGQNLSDGKLTAVDFNNIEQLGALFDVVFIEADGAKGRPLKCPAYYEPVIPPFSERIFVIGGLYGLWKKIDEAVFRWELFCEASGMECNSVITPQVFLKFFTENVLLKGIEKIKYTIILNQYDTLNSKGVAGEIAKGIIGQTQGVPVIITSTFFNVLYLVERGV